MHFFYKQETYAEVAKMARQGCDRDKSPVWIYMRMPKWPNKKGKNGIRMHIHTRDLSL